MERKSGESFTSSLKFINYIVTIQSSVICEFFNLGRNWLKNG